jgi:DNA-binding PadR family transcriptional regulator
MMRDSREPRLSLAELLVLCVVAEKPTHGFAVAVQLTPDSALGAVWHVARPQVYLSLERLTAPGLGCEAGREHSRTGPVRQLCEVTLAGQQLARAWLARSAEHGRDVRSELMVKLALLDRVGADAGGLVSAQRDQLAVIAGALDERLGAAEGMERILITWRREQMSASWSLTPRISTAFTFTGARPELAAAARPAKTSGSRSRRASSLKVSRDRVSRDTFIRSSPAAASGPASRASPMPLVVSEISGRGSSAAAAATRPGRPTWQGFAAGEPDLGDAEPLHGDRDQPGHLVVGEQRGTGQPVQALGGHAVGAPQVAPVSDRHPQVRGDPPERVR